MKAGAIFLTAAAAFCLLVPALLSGCGKRLVLTSGTSRDTNVTARRLLPVDSNKIHVYFVREKGDGIELVSVERQARQSDKLKDAVEELLRGPSAAEVKAGIKNEIPLGTILLSVKQERSNGEIDLSRRFVIGGETSIETRLHQLQRTVSDAAADQKIFLNVEGKRLLSVGEGLEVKQPLN